MRIAVFAGTFDPVTSGHEEIIKKSASLFDEVIVALCVNVTKKALFSVEKRLEFLTAVCEKYANVKVIYHEGLLVDLMKKIGATYNVRGVRNATDYEYENEMHYYNEKLYKDIVTLYIPCSKELKDVSSTAVKKDINSGNFDEMHLSPSVIEIIKKQGKKQSKV